jgi:hypothetical protein
MIKLVYSSGKGYTFLLGPIEDAFNRWLTDEMMKDLDKRELGHFRCEEE